MINIKSKIKKKIDETRCDGFENSSRYENLVYRAVSEELISMSKASSLLQKSLEELKQELSINIS